MALSVRPKAKFCFTFGTLAIELLPTGKALEPHVPASLGVLGFGVVIHLIGGKQGIRGFDADLAAKMHQRAVVLLLVGIEPGFLAWTWSGRTGWPNS